MRLRSITTFAVAAAAILATYACSGDSPAAPQTQTQIAPSSQGSQSLIGDLLGGGKVTNTTIVPLLRQTPLSSDLTVTKSIGVLGGTIAIPQAGLTLVVPPLAVGKTTSFKITARKGNYVAYDMEPHGTKFLVPLVATQNLSGTNAKLLNLSLQLGYYTDPTKITTVSELLSVQVDLLKLTAVSTIPHFSGYIWASGRDEE